MAIEYDVTAYPIPPGELLEEDLSFRGIDMATAADALCLPVGQLRGLLEGSTPLTPELAARIEAFLGSPAHLWLGLEEDYRAALAKKQALDAQQHARTGTG